MCGRVCPSFSRVLLSRKFRGRGAAEHREDNDHLGPFAILYCSSASFHGPFAILYENLVSMPGALWGVVTYLPVAASMLGVSVNKWLAK